MDITIETELQYQAALKRAEQLMDTELDTQEGRELNVLTAKIENYEAEHFPVGRHRKSSGAQ